MSKDDVTAATNDVLDYVSPDAPSCADLFSKTQCLYTRLVDKRSHWPTPTTTANGARNKQ